jgi:hypothetical protein
MRPNLPMIEIEKFKIIYNNAKNSSVNSACKVACINSTRFEKNRIFYKLPPIVKKKVVL